VTQPLLLLLLLLLLQVPEGVSDEEAILLGDILSTAFFCVDQGSVSDGDVVVVLGCGPVGLLAVLAARQRGAAQVGVAE
jgi:threonine dehydrogenase-like Zn-dependent dehydrogenase